MIGEVIFDKPKVAYITALRLQNIINIKINIKNVATSTFLLLLPKKN